MSDPKSLESEPDAILTFDEAVTLLPPGREIHTFIEGGPVLLGASWSRKSILALLRKADKQAIPGKRIKITGPQAQRMKHGLVAWDDAHQHYVFIATVERTDARLMA